MAKPARVFGAALLLASIAALAVSIPAMTRQIRAENADADLPFFGMRTPAPEAMPFIDGTASFSWGIGKGQEVVALTLVDDDTLRVAYRGEAREVPITGMIDERLPGFARFRDDQIKLIVVSEEHPRRRDEQPVTSEPVRPDRLILAVRIERAVRPDEDPSEMAGLVDRKAWRYELLEFTPPGAPPGAPADGPMITVHEIAYSDLPEWERTWQYAAALNVTPTLKFPKLKDPMGSNRGLDGVTWPFPVAASAVLVGAVGVILLAGSFVRREPDGAPPRASDSPARGAAGHV